MADESRSQFAASEKQVQGALNKVGWFTHLGFLDEYSGACLGKQEES